MLKQEKTATVADVQALADLPENQDQDFELIAGVIYAVTTPSPLHNIIVTFLVAALFNYVHPRRMGRVFGERTGYRLDDENLLIPDVSYLSYDRQPALPAQFTLAPDLAVEVVSPGNTAEELQTKILTYLRFGTRLIWVVYPTSRTVVVHTAQQTAFTLTAADTLDGADVLPDFRLPLADLFAEIG